MQQWLLAENFDENSEGHYPVNSQFVMYFIQREHDGEKYWEAIDTRGGRHQISKVAEILVKRILDDATRAANFANHVPKPSQTRMAQKPIHKGGSRTT